MDDGIYLPDRMVQGDPKEFTEFFVTVWNISPQDPIKGETPFPE
jgi:hypothetical protein